MTITNTEGLSDERLAEMLALCDRVNDSAMRTVHMTSGLSLNDDKFIQSCDPGTIRSIVTELQSLRATREGDGEWVMVPREPTEAMKVAGLREVDPLGELLDWHGKNTATREDILDVYRAMIAAIPATGEKE